MASAKLYQNKLLTENGKLAIGNDCCCDDCPECPPLSSLPQLCYLKITVPASLTVTNTELNLYLVYTETYGSRPQWTKSVVDGICYYNYDISLEMPCCVSNCSDSCAIDLDPDPFVCGPYPATYYCDPTCDSGTDTDECVGEVTVTYAGDVKAALRDVASDAYARVQYRYNCETGVIERKVNFYYIFSNILRARFVGTATYDYEPYEPGEGEDPPPACCYDACQVVENYNNGSTAAPTNACATSPLFPDVSGSGVTGFDHELWMDPLTCFQQRGHGQIEYDEDWTVVGAVFSDTNLTPEFVLPKWETPIHRCDQIESGSVEFEVEEDFAVLSFDCAAAQLAKWTAWFCDDVNQTPDSTCAGAFPGLTKTTKSLSDSAGSHAINFVTTTDLSLSACSEWTDLCQPSNDQEMV